MKTTVRNVMLVAAMGLICMLIMLFYPENPPPVPDRRHAGQAVDGNQNERQSNLRGVPILGTVPEFSLTDQTGNDFGTTELRGKVWIANFFFTRCLGTCPQQSARMAELQGRLAREPVWDGIRLLSFSVDPNHDTPGVLRKYAQQFEADETHWKFLTGSRETVWQICHDGFKLPVAENPGNQAMPIFHDSKFVLVDRLGRIRGYYDSLSDKDMIQLERDLGFVVPEMTPPDYAKAAFADAGDQLTHLAQPPTIVDMEWLAERRDAQLADTEQFQVYYDFQFSDRVEESGITFLPQIVDEQRWRLQVNHYDHGNGICVADVDRDGLYDIYFLAQAGGNELWRNLGGGKFENITETAGVAVIDRISVTASFADTDNDGDPDLYVTTVRGGNILFVNDGTGKFEDVTRQAGLTYSGHSSAPVFFDYNRDGLLDLFLCNVGKYTTDELVPVRIDSVTSLPEGDYKYYVGVKDAFAGHLKPGYSEQSILYRNEGDNRFVDVSAETGLLDTSWTGDASPLDINGDGWLDLYLLSMQGHDEYYENVEGKRFVKKSREVFPKTPWGSMGIKVFDFDNDADMDILLTDMHSDMSEDIGPEREKLKSRMKWPESFLQSGGNSIFGNAFFKNNGAGKFQEVSDQLGVENYWPWGFSVGDLNADGYEDVFVTASMCFPYRYGVNSVLLNNRGKKFLDSEFLLRVEPRPDGRTIKPWFELDCSGKDKDNPICKGRSGRIVVWSALGSRSSVIFDLDDDGDLDIVTNDFNSKPLVLVSNLAEKKELRFLKIKLVGSKSNRDALGAVVQVVTAAQTYTKVHDGKSGYLSQSLIPLYFGLNAAERVDRIQIIWPSGSKQELSGPLETNTTIEITEE